MAGAMLLRLVLLLLSPLAMAQTQDGAASGSSYCSLCADHTMCLYSGVGAQCRQGRFVNGVSAAERNQIVQLHNALRSLVASGGEGRGRPGPQPSAADMQRMEWDEEVATVAQRWADQCNYRHDQCRNVPGSYVGQNIYMRSQYPVSAMDAAANWTEPVYAWYDEVALMPNSEVSGYRGGSDIGHYTQLVWASTNRVGCGYAFFQDGDWAKKYYVCDYRPGGNSLGQPLYTAGAPASACPNGPDGQFPSLCASSSSSSSGDASKRSTRPNSSNSNPSTSSNSNPSTTPSNSNPSSSSNPSNSSPSNSNPSTSSNSNPSPSSSNPSTSSSSGANSPSSSNAPSRSNARTTSRGRSRSRPRTQNPASASAPMQTIQVLDSPSASGTAPTAAGDWIDESTFDLPQQRRQTSAIFTSDNNYPYYYF